MQQHTRKEEMGTHVETFGESRKWTGSIRILANVSVRASPLKGVVAYCNYGNNAAEDEGPRWKVRSQYPDVKIVGRCPYCRCVKVWAGNDAS